MDKIYFKVCICYIIACGWHAACFTCSTCDQLLVDLTYCIREDKVIFQISLPSFFSLLLYHLKNSYRKNLEIANKFFTLKLFLSTISVLVLVIRVFEFNRTTSPNLVPTSDLKALKMNRRINCNYPPFLRSIVNVILLNYTSHAVQHAMRLATY